MEQIGRLPKWNNYIKLILNLNQKKKIIGI